MAKQVKDFFGAWMDKNDEIVLGMLIKSNEYRDLSLEFYTHIMGVFEDVLVDVTSLPIRKGHEEVMGSMICKKNSKIINRTMSNNKIPTFSFSLLVNNLPIQVTFFTRETNFIDSIEENSKKIFGDNVKLCIIPQAS